MYPKYMQLQSLGKRWGEPNNYLKCHGQSSKPCPDSAYASWRVSLGNKQYHDLCKSCEKKVRRRYLRQRNIFYQQAMEGKIKTPLADGGIILV